ncbi:DinB family protein [Brevibacillus invocatus]|uniref:DinB family protein n=1 Tax=Brevibacillus invocatus TaxID=173959 RepID=UPI0020407601|nr:DinB family protein [Brevibacillus invocatus]MCM3079800.1 DinB family protein [Brevibacillus invocatus]MCM3429993.1 DinB family protein [Brevibacillus invocatus]
MDVAKEMKKYLFEELTLITNTTAGLIRKISAEDWTYQPRENMRSLLELVQHLVAIPAVDLLILQEKSREEVNSLEAVFAQDRDPESLINKMTQDLDKLKAYMEALSDEDFLYKKTTPFYLPHGTEQAKWLIEIVTHAQHHRGQLFTYLKTKGYEVNMFDLY